MAFSTSLPPSVTAKMAKGEGEDEPQKQSREDYKKMKELEEARKAGSVPAMQDEDGKDINPHIPQYIMQAPWYIGEDRPTLKHQRPQEEKFMKYSGKDDWYKKGVKEGPVTTKFRKGACENCGAMTHKKIDCLERPRKVGAKYTGNNFAPDEYIQANLRFDYEGKRDRWNGYNPEEHQKVYEQFEKIEAAKRFLKEQKVEDDLFEGKKEKEIEKPDADSDDEDKYAEDVAMPGQKFETKQRITVRNLRIREDMAKYLFNLDPNSAFYDPKTRSMRENPLKNTGKEGEIGFRGDNVARFSGDASQFAKQQMFAWEAYEHGTDVHIQADPTKLALLTKEVEKRKDDKKTTAKNSILEKYGGEEHLEAPPKQLLMAQTEDYVEYSRTGSVIKGAEKPIVRSKYQEDVYINNHTTVWGSFWRSGQWGFKCCHSCVKESYCTGQAGIDATSERSLISQEIAIAELLREEEAQKSLVEQHQENMTEKKKKKKKKNKHKKKKKRSSSSSDESDQPESDDDNEEKKAKKLKKAIQRELDHQKNVAEIMTLDERKRPYNSMFDAKLPTEDEMEAWRLKRARMDDPMAGL